jgi:hypothetical protein
VAADASAAAAVAAAAAAATLEGVRVKLGKQWPRRTGVCLALLALLVHKNRY